jgi:hypothetical protein
MEFKTHSALRKHIYRSARSKETCKQRQETREHIIKKEQIIKKLSPGELVDAIENNTNEKQINEELSLQLKILRGEFKKISYNFNHLVKTIKKQKITLARPIMTQPRRLEIAASQQWNCNDCSKMLSSVFEIDHIIRWVDSYDDSNENLQALCMECHKIKSAEENQK